jgi:putative ABC transport system substrate-binding protein
LIRDLFPSIKVLGLLIDPNDPVAESVVTELETAIRPFGITLRVVRAGSDHELDQAFVSLAQNKVGAVIVNTDPFYRTRMNEIVSLAAQHAIPDMYSGRDYAVAGGLVGYGADIAEAYRQQGVYVGKILNGEKPGDLPVLQSTKFEFVINLKTAKRLGLTLPSALLSIADDLIE